MSNAKQTLLFDELGTRRVEADFRGGHLSSDGGVLLLRQVDRGLGVLRSLAECFVDGRDRVFVDHELEPLLAQRVYGLALGYEDLNDHERLRLDPLLAVAVGKCDPLGEDRLRDRGVALAAPSTLNRLELGNSQVSRYHKVQHDPKKVEQSLLKLAVRCLPKHSPELILDMDSMGHLVHGLQQGRHFSAFYDGYCYQPLYVVCGEVVLWAQLRTGHTQPTADAVQALKVIVPLLRKRCPRARILVRGDSAFCREEIMHFCEEQKLSYVLGLARNATLEKHLAEAFFWLEARRCLSGASNPRSFVEFEYQTRETWTRARRIIGKAELTAGSRNPRFVATNLPRQGLARAAKGALDARVIYEEIYCGRGNMENILKQQVLDLEADRMSTHFLASNQLRLWLASFAYLLVERLRAWGLASTELASATVGTLRAKLLKVAASVQISVRRVYVQFPSAFPRQALFRQCLAALKARAMLSG
jgi:hypothetical protein